MEGIIFDIKRFAIHDGPGLRTTIFLKGCPLNCWWCHNPESINPEIETYTSVDRLGEQTFKTTKQIGRKATADEVFIEIKKEAIFMEEGNGGLTISGGEPLLQPEFTAELLKLCINAGIHTTIDTAGAVTFNKFRMVIPFTNLFLFDIKLINYDNHKKYIGADNRLILQNFKEVVKAGKKVIARIPIIPNVNLNKTELNMMLIFFLPLKGENFNEIHLLPYHHIGQSKYNRFNKHDRMNDIKEPKNDDLFIAIQIFEDAGFIVKIHS